MANSDRFGPLLGVISIDNTYCKFLIYAARNAEVLTCHEIKLKQIVPNAGWLEFDPANIWSSTLECIETACQKLIILDIDPTEIVAVGVSNQRGTTILWDKDTGDFLHNAIGGSDSRSASTVKSILGTTKGKINYIKPICGLPLSTCFSAVKIKWLSDNYPTTKQKIAEGDCLFGTLDSWIIWNLTGGPDNGIHVTDVTNAAYTSLMNIKTLHWDEKLCRFFGIPKAILPGIRSNAEILGYIQSGPLKTLPIACCMGDQPAALLGQLCTNIGQSACTIDESCFLLINTGQEVIDSDHGLNSIVAYKLGAEEKTWYAVEGAISNGGSSTTWLREKLQISTELNQNEDSAELLSNFLSDDSMISSYCSSSVPNGGEGSLVNKSDIVFVPAFNGLYSPYWNYDAKGLILGLTAQTTAEHITQSAFESTGFQIREILDCFRKDTPNWEPITKLIVGGDFSENNKFMKIICDVTGVLLEHPETTSASCLGVMLATGIAMKILTIDDAKLTYTPPSYIFHPKTTANRREILYRRWNYAVKKCINWDNFESFENDGDIFMQREFDHNARIRASIPGGLFLTTSFILLIIAEFMQSHS